MSTGSFEQIFLALAVRNKMMTTQAAQACLQEFGSQPAEDMHGIDEIVMSRGLITEEQSAALSAAARKLTSATKTEKVSTHQTTTTRRILGNANPKEPVPGYQFIAKLGTGGTSTVFLAQETRPPGRKVALKILHPSKAADPRALKRFQNEAELLVSLDHANLVKGFAHGQHGPLVYLAMEFLDGETALDLLDREGGFSEKRAVEIALQVAEVLAYLQASGFVHCDIKPGNIMLLKNGSSKLLDLGFAKPVGKAGAPESETTSGTVQYMSPEQARGQADLDARADIYSLGATLYHMVMGQVPFSGGDSLEVMAKHVLEALNSTEIKNRRFSKHLHYFIERMMTKDKALRYQSPKELIEDIQSQMEGFSSLEFKPEQQRPVTARILQGYRGNTNPVDGGGNATRRLKPPPHR
ncbi:MAG TPA: serine/threonine-protein kinase [Planctomycetota bacterium]|nr:serine/threonine-protein kinase [Planctomycetota bacterium]